MVAVAHSCRSTLCCCGLKRTVAPAQSPGGAAAPTPFAAWTGGGRMGGGGGRTRGCSAVL